MLRNRAIPFLARFSRSNASVSVEPTRYQLLKSDLLHSHIPATRMWDDHAHNLAYGTDASFYRLIPELVVRVESEREVQSILAAAHVRRTPITFRAAGTSLSGQAVTDSVLVKLGSNWRRMQISPNGSEIVLQPGVIAGQANQALAKHHRRLGPDPSSVDSCMIGGIVNNNSSGMCCGVAQNTYHTMKHLRIVLADGTVLDTGSESSVSSFKVSHAALCSELAKMAREVQANAELSEKIKRKYRIKCTTGYSLNALTDFGDDPIEILKHLIVGSEGTLAFVSEVTYNTVPNPPHRASALIMYDTIDLACDAAALLQTAPADAAELMDRPSLRSATHILPEVASLGENVSALLVETRSSTTDDLRERIAKLRDVLKVVPTVRPIEFGEDAATNERLWSVRRGLIPLVGGVRAVGSSAILEDVAVQVSELAPLTRDLQSIFHGMGYNDAIIFGHALSGNLHLLFSQFFDTPKEIQRYSEMMDALCETVAVKYNGSLKAEHGTGRNVAPYVEMEWGTAAYQYMWRVKRLLDPHNILNPGVLLNDNHKVHLENLKPMPAADPIVDKCIECGFCESACPSRDLTVTPRQRIVLYREMQALERAPQTAEVQKKLTQLKNMFEYAGDATCAADGMCATKCPVEINTGALIKKLRTKHAVNPKIAGMLANRFDTAATGANTTLSLTKNVAKVVGEALPQYVSAYFNMVLTNSAVPIWNPSLPEGAPRITIPAGVVSDSATEVPYFVCCSNRVMGPPIGQKPLPDTILSLMEKANLRPVVPHNMNNLCCGMPFSSRGYPEQAKAKADELTAALRAMSGNSPVLFDMSQCVQEMQQRGAGTLVTDITTFVNDRILPRVKVQPVTETVVLHAPCSAKKMGLEPKMRTLSSKLASTVLTPPTTCCGMAGDRGLRYPELPASALAWPLQGINSKTANSGVSSSRTCECALSLHSGVPFMNIAYLADRATVKPSIN
eukprot:TRINITY_DN11863_c0_g1_i1.p1 TRINITY_DN11863_c0_g1~~TRINITY_DN11863_c0_g1_i1.p1  ORF type:complete len:962 (+),score=192.21 TRINITY_DN11863_c0_g1_i1:56-2941(+)